MLEDICPVEKKKEVERVGGVAAVESLWTLPEKLGHRRFWQREFALGEPLLPLAHQ